MFNTEKIQAGSTLAAFIGGVIGAMSHYIASIQILLDLKVQELFDYAVHSLVGGLVMLAVKLTGDGLIYLLKRYMDKRKRDRDKQDNV